MGNWYRCCLDTCDHNLLHDFGELTCFEIERVRYEEKNEERDIDPVPRWDRIAQP